MYCFRQFPLTFEENYILKIGHFLLERGHSEEGKKEEN